MASASWLNGWLTGDLVTAAEFQKSAGSISDTTLGSAAANINVTSIPGGYAHLLIHLYARSDNASANTTCLMRFNGDTAANYDYQQLRGSATTSTAAEAFAQTSMLVANAIPANTATANVFGGIDIWIPNYAGSANNKCAISSFAHKEGTATTNLQAGETAAFWRSNSAITQVTLLPGAGNFNTGTRMTVYVFGA